MESMINSNYLMGMVLFISLMVGIGLLRIGINENYWLDTLVGGITIIATLAVAVVIFYA